MELVVLKKVKKGFIEKKTLKRLKGGLNKKINSMKSLCKCILTLWAIIHQKEIQKFFFLWVNSSLLKLQANVVVIIKNFLIK
jgi:hypothetical protein